MNKTTKLFPSLLILSAILSLTSTARSDTLTVESDLNVQGTLTVGDSETPAPQEGSIRWTGTDLECFDGSEWKSLTQNSDSPAIDQTLAINGDQLTISGTGGNTVTLPAGINGVDGQDGATWLVGSGVPDDADGVERDLYLNTENGDFYVKASAAWGTPAGNLKGVDGTNGADGIDGADGANGSDGVDGARWLTGYGTPDNTNGSDGDLYLDTESGDYYIKASGGWGSAIGNLTGPQGIAGPAGEVGDAYFSENADGNISLESSKLGLGTASPSVRLDVVGDAKVSGLLTVEGSLVLTEHQGDIPMYQSAND